MNPIRIATVLLLMTCFGAAFGIARVVAAAPAAPTKTAAAEPTKTAASAGALAHSMASRERALRAAAGPARLGSVEQDWEGHPVVRAGVILPARG